MILWNGSEINLIWLILIFFTFYMIFFGFLIHFLTPLTPKIISDAFGYGKTTNANLSTLVRWIQVPKAYFTHFYVFSVLLMAFLWMMTVKTVILEQPNFQSLDHFLNFVCQENRMTKTSPEAILIVMSLMTLQCARRLYECLYVNIDTGSKMNILHYIVGFAHYFCCGFGYISEAPGFAEHPNSFVKWVHIEPDITNINILQWASILLYAWAWKHQLKSHQIFAELKLKTSGSHSVPHGDWFQYVSCPHYFAEILIYLSLAFICGFKHKTAWLIFVWVLTNQVIAGLMSHWWYQKTFRTYPTKRKAVIPFLL